MHIKLLNEKEDFSRIIEIWKQMWHYLRPESPDKTKTLFHADMKTFGAHTILSRDFIVAEDGQGLIIGSAGILKSSSENLWRVWLAVLPEYVKSDLPEKLLDAIVDLAKKQNPPELQLSISKQFLHLIKILETREIKPIKRKYFMRLDDFGINPQLEVPFGITLRKQESTKNLSGFIAVFNKAFQDSFGFTPLVEEKYIQILDSLDTSIQRIFCFAEMENESQPVGCSQLTINPKQNNRAFIKIVGVLPDYQRQGIGRALMIFSIELLQKMGSKIIELSVWVDNEKALRLYKECGFYELENQTEFVYTIL